MTVVFMIVSAMLVERSFLTGWVQMGEKSSRKRRRKKTTKGGKKSSLKRPVVALTVKEWNLVKRDLREWLTLMPIFFFFVFGLIGFLDRKSTRLNSSHVAISYAVFCLK